MMAGEALLIEPIDYSPDPNPVQKVLFDFEKDWASNGWLLEGSAFGESPMTNQQHASRGIVGRKYAASFYGHDGGLGKAISPEFTIDRDYLHFKIAGGSEKEILGVHLMVDGQSVYQEVGKKTTTWNGGLGTSRNIVKKGAGKISRRIKGWMGLCFRGSFRTLRSGKHSKVRRFLPCLHAQLGRLACFHEATFEPEQKSRCYLWQGHALCLDRAKRDRTEDSGRIGQGWNPAA